MKIPPWSYSFLSSYRTCPHQAYRKYVKRDLPRMETPAQKRGNDVHTAMEKRVRDGTPLPPDMPYEQFAAALDGRECKVELKLGITQAGVVCDFFSDNVFGRGKLDIVILPAKEFAFLVDWKTGKVREDPAELKVQALLLNAKFPALRHIHGHYVWLNEKQLGVPHDLSDTLRTWNDVCATVREMETSKWEKTPNPLCGWCDVKDCEHNRSK